MNRKVKKIIDNELEQKFLEIKESDYIQNGKLTVDGEFYFNQVVNEILNKVLNIEERDLNDMASFIYDDKGSDVMGIEEIIEYCGMRLVDYITPIKRKDHKIYVGVVMNDNEYSFYSYGATTCYYDENPDVESPEPYTTTLKDLEYISKTYNNVDFEEEFNRISKTNTVDYHKIVKLLFTDKFYYTNKETQNYLLKVFIKQVNISKLTNSQREIIAKFLHNKQAYSSLSPNEKKQIHRITNKMNK